MQVDIHRLCIEISKFLSIIERSYVFSIALLGALSNDAYGIVFLFYMH